METTALFISFSLKGKEGEGLLINMVALNWSSSGKICIHITQRGLYKSSIFRKFTGMASEKTAGSEDWLAHSTWKIYKKKSLPHKGEQELFDFSNMDPKWFKAAKPEAEWLYIYI